jgi:hypothetical protein
MLELLRLLVEVCTAASWIIFFIAAVIAVFVVYVGIAMWAVIRGSCDPEQRQVRYRVFRDLLRIFDRGRRQ